MPSIIRKPKPAAMARFLAFVSLVSCFSLQRTKVMGFIPTKTAFTGWRSGHVSKFPTMEIASAFSRIATTPSRTSLDYQSITRDSGAWAEGALRIQHEGMLVSPSTKQQALGLLPDPSMVEIRPCTTADDTTSIKKGNDLLAVSNLSKKKNKKYMYASSAMLQACAPYIAAHTGKIAVFHIPGELLLEREDGEIAEEDDDETRRKKNCPYYTDETILRDIAISWLMGMKIILVVSCRHKADESCSKGNFDHAHECQNSLRIIGEDTMRLIEEEAGLIRFEIERKLNKSINKLHFCTSDQGEGNIVGGNSFYTAKCYGVGPNGENFKHIGCVHHVNDDNIHQVLDNNDIVLLTTVGTNPRGDMVNVNGNHLAATVAASLDAYKLVYMANHGSVFTTSCSDSSDTDSGATEPELLSGLPLSFAKDLLQYHNVRIHDKGGFATFNQARKRLPPHAVEMLLHLGWASWALEKGGVSRAHIVNPSKDGAILEELFTSKNGQNTCLSHDSDYMQEQMYDQDYYNEENDELDDFGDYLDQEDLEAYLDSSPNMVLDDIILSSTTTAANGCTAQYCSK